MVTVPSHGVGEIDRALTELTDQCRHLEVVLPKTTEDPAELVHARLDLAISVPRFAQVIERGESIRDRALRSRIYATVSQSVASRSV